METPDPRLPLAGIRVVDFSKVLAGPLCTQYLSDFGAEVVKVEPAEKGDDTRSWPPFADGEGTIFLAVNRNKRSLAVDLKSAEGRAICQRLLAQADVVIESFGPGVAERLGVGYEAVRALKPDAIYCSISGYGTQGSMKDGKGYDLVAQAFTGMLSVTGEPDGPPVRSPFSPVDQGTGMNAAIGILGALLRREHGGGGARIEASLFDTAVGLLGYFPQGFWQRGTEPQRLGSGHESLCPYKAFETAVAEIMRRRTRAEWTELLEARGIPCSPVHNLGELSRHPHTQASGMLLQYTSAAGRAMQGVATPLRIDGERLALRAAPPALGQDSESVLRELGYPEEDITRWRREGVVGAAHA